MEYADRTMGLRLMKSLGWRIIASGITMALAYGFTGHLGLAGAIGGADAAIKIFVYMIYDELWSEKL